MLSIDTSITPYAKLAKVSQNNLLKIQIKTVRDLIFHFPTRYEDLSETVLIANVKIGQKITIKGRIDLINTKRSPYKKMNITEALISDNTGTMKAIWFNQAFIGKILNQGDSVFLSGVVNADYIGIQMTNPSYEKESINRREGSTIHTGRVVPIYPQTQGVSSRQLRLMLKHCLPYIKDIDEWLPNELLNKFNLCNYQEALKQIHYPDSKIKCELALERLKFDELFIVQLYAQNLRQLLGKSECFEIKFFENETKQFVERLKFKLTDDQRKSAWEILQDINKKTGPMNRLLEGDVGSGKTVVSAIALLNVFLNSYQSVLLVPTEILATQHFDSMIDFFKQTQIKIGLITRGFIKYYDSSCEQTISLKKNELLDKIKKQEVDLIIGTHTLLQNGVDFAKLALIVVDEQHRFGVKQRQLLKEKIQNKLNISPHFLSMTATPIPRSLALALYGDLDLSIILALPKGRKPIITKLFKTENRQEAYNLVLSQIKNGRQCFVVCPLVNSSDKLGVKSVESEFKRLDKEIFKEASVGKLHGKLKKNEKAQIMEEFVLNKINVLISTSVIEVGVDVPNASVIIIEDADRFGLAQLHQFRGRVGRSEYQSYCFLFVSDDVSKEAIERLEKFCNIYDGFKLAELDLQTRGAGDVYGYAQSGATSLKLAKITDTQIIKKAGNCAKYILENFGIDNLPSEAKKRLAEFSNLVDLE